MNSQLSTYIFCREYHVDYLKGSTEKYYQVLGVYKNVIRANDDIKKKKMANSLRKNTERGFLKQRSTISTNDENIEIKKASALQKDKSIIEYNLQALIHSLAHLSSVEDVGVHNKEVDGLMLECENIKRDINISIRQLKHSKVVHENPLN